MDTTLTTPTGLDARPYQEEGIQFLMQHKRALLADAPGLGKTFQAAEATYRSNQFPAMIFCPGFLVGQWAEFLSMQYPDTVVSVATKNHYLHRIKALEPGAQWYVCGLTMLQDVGYWKWPLFKTLIFDESHHLKSRRSKQARGAATLSKQGQVENIFELTATPVRREFDDMYQQLHILRPDLFTSFKAFCKAFCVTTSSQWEELQVIGIKNPEEVRKLLDLFMLRRTYKDVKMYLPEIIQTVIPVELDDQTRKSYERAKSEYILQFEKWEDSESGVPLLWAVEVLQVLRQLTCCQEKIEAAIDLALDSPKPVIFTWYKHSAEILASLLDKKAITGSVKAQDRAGLAKEQSIAIITLASLSEGVDLSQFRTVIFFEEDYSPGVNYQALSRVARFGFDEESGPLIVYYLQAVNSVDVTVHNKAESRAGSIKSILKEVLI